MPHPVSKQNREVNKKPLTDDDIRDGFRLLDLEDESKRRSLRENFGTPTLEDSDWGELVTRSNAEPSESVERFRAQLQSDPK